MMSFTSLSKGVLLNMLIVLRSQSAGGECLSRGMGKLVGPFQRRDHGVGGTVYMVDGATLFIDSFSYDGKGPDAYFWVGDAAEPSPHGTIVPYPPDATGGLASYDGPSVLLKLPGGKTVDRIKWLAVWCKEANANYGDVKIPKGMVLPRPRRIGQLSGTEHRVGSGNITIVDGKTFNIPKLNYDGKSRDTFFMAGTGSRPNGDGTRVPDDVGSLQTLRRYSNMDVTIKLPGYLTACDINWLAIYNQRYDRDYGHVLIPKDLDVPPDVGQNSKFGKESFRGSGAVTRHSGSISAVFACFINFSAIEI